MIDKFFQFVDSYYYLILFVASLIICRLPLLGKYFKIIDTLFHELGHAIATLFMRGEVIAIELEKDTSGSTTYLTEKNISHFIVSIMGYPFSAAIALFLAYLYGINNIKFFFLFMYGCLAVTLFVFIRNIFGVIWIVFFAALLILVHIYLNPIFQKDIIFIITSVLFWESIVSSVNLFILSVRTPKNSGDAFNLSEITKMPPVFWAFIFIVAVVFIGYFTLQMLFPMFSVAMIKSMF